MSTFLGELSLPQAGQRHLHWSMSANSSYALALAEAIKAYAGVVVIVAENTMQALQLEDELRFFLAADCPILHFPDWETLPYDHFSPHQDIISDRLQALHDLPLLKQGVLITTIATLMHKIAPPAHISGNSFVFKQGDKLNEQALKDKLVACNYIHVAKVMEHGEFSIRGSIIDIFPMGCEHPLRLDLFDDEIESIKAFDVDTQRSSAAMPEFRLLPAREFPLDEQAITQFRQQWRARFSGNPVNCPVYEEISQGVTPAGIEYYIPLFYQEMQSLFAYLPAQALLVNMVNCHDMAQQFWHEVNERFEQLNIDVTRPLLPVHELYLAVEDVFALINQHPRISYVAASSTKSQALPFTALPKLAIQHQAEQPLAALKALSAKEKVIFCVESAGRREALLELLHDADINPVLQPTWTACLHSEASLCITEGLLSHGFASEAYYVITEADLLPQAIMQRRSRKKRTSDTDVIIRDLAELKIGAPIVHIDHGVGRYLGLQTLSTGGVNAEYLTLEYAGKDKVYVPITGLDRISRYSGSSDDSVALTKLGNDKWSRAKRKALEKIHDVAAELLDIYAKREAQQGTAFAHPDKAYHSFAAAFSFEPTPDQEQAFAQVLSDMTSAKKMDRLICGDVGFGKTEVAMRAAFIAAYNGKQVAMLVPTTLLANQHFENFKNRFADFAISIELLSRFRTAQEQAATLERLAAGKVDIVIGTHKLIQKDIQFANLGLLIVDEEHRFGVKQKDNLKKLRANVDMLAMTATPIPRTLNMSLSGLRDISIIATPPEKRLSIKTFAHQYQAPLIREAVLREIMRGGQVFYLHNNVDTMARVRHDLSKLIPEASIEIAHGQMPERELEKVMSDFYHRRFNVLLCTTIVETGIDIPTANTIIIDRADHFGLAQLHQLRGRVGRSHHQAYAYLIVPDKKAMTSDARKRLEAFLSLDDLGAGFTLATHDMEIRGAGEILGDEQSGHMQAIGFSLYMDMLNRAVSALKAGKAINTADPFADCTEINLNIPALIPEAYVADVQLRLSLYKRLASCDNREALKELQVEFIDRFGLLPDEVKNLFKVTELKLAAKQLGIKKIEANAKGGRIDFVAKPNIEPIKIIQLIQQSPQYYKLDGPDRLKYIDQALDTGQRIESCRKVIQALSS